MEENANITLHYTACTCAHLHILPPQFAFQVGSSLLKVSSILVEEVYTTVGYIRMYTDVHFSQTHTGTCSQTQVYICTYTHLRTYTHLSPRLHMKVSGTQSPIQAIILYLLNTTLQQHAPAQAPHTEQYLSSAPSHPVYLPSQPPWTGFPSSLPSPTQREIGVLLESAYGR